MDSAPGLLLRASNFRSQAKYSFAPAIATTILLSELIRLDVYLEMKQLLGARIRRGLDG